MTALSPEPQTLLMVSAGTSPGTPARIMAWRAGAWPDAALQHMAHDHFVHGGGFHAGPAEGLTNDDGPELRGRKRRQAAEIAPDGGADSGDEDGDRGIAHRTSSVREFDWPKIPFGRAPPGGERRAAPLSPCPAYTSSARVRISPVTRATNSSTGITSCLFPAPRTRTATVPASASRCPTTAMYGTLRTSPSRIR